MIEGRAGSGRRVPRRMKLWRGGPVQWPRFWGVEWRNFAIWQGGIRCVSVSVLDDSVGREGGIHLAIYLSSFRGGFRRYPPAHMWSRKYEMLVRGKMPTWKTAPDVRKAIRTTCTSVLDWSTPLLVFRLHLLYRTTSKIITDFLAFRA
jgi:hypothetical protein